MSERATSAITLGSNRFVAEHLPRAASAGKRLAAEIEDPESFVATLVAALRDLADPVYAEGIRSVTPGLGPVLGVRQPLLTAAQREFRRATRRTSTALLISAMDRALREELREIRWFAIWNLGRLLPSDPERTWQLLRRTARGADEWVTVDTLAHPYGDGILLDPRRWAELEQLVYSPSRWERRLVGSTLATLPFAGRSRGGREPVVAERGLELVGQLIGDHEPDVQKALAWALRSLVLVDPEAVRRFLESETEFARASDDGNRAWVIRDATPKLPASDAVRLRASLVGIRRRAGGGSTSRAAAIAAEFLGNLPASPVGAAGAASHT